MGPGFLPACATAGLVVLALASLAGRGGVVVAACEQGSVRPLFFATAGVVGFALLVEPAGGLLAAMFLSSLAGLAAGLSPLRAMCHGCVLGAGSLLLFVHLLDVPIRMLPAFAGH
jgi:putative tricarboxylic transport membrane protein